MKKIKLLFIIFFVGGTLFYKTDTTIAEKDRKYYESLGYVVWDIQTQEKIIALTFDDGPHPIYTKQILDLLKQYEAKGTFFLVGKQAENNPEIVLRMNEEGHAIGNHTYTHPSSKSVPQIMKEIEQTNTTLINIIGYSPKLFRPVEGYYTEQLINEVVKEGYQMVMWSWHQDTEDWRDPGVNKIVGKVLNGAAEGNIVLFHDGGSNRQQTVQALEIILPELKKQGYTFVTVAELLELQNERKAGK